jgi:hypothetical protein
VKITILYEYNRVYLEYRGIEGGIIPIGRRTGRRIGHVGRSLIIWTKFFHKSQGMRCNEELGFRR